MEKVNKDMVSDDWVLNKIYMVRGKKVMLDLDLAELYGVETKQLKRQVRRNIERFPQDFLFELTTQEFNILRSQIGTASWGGTRVLPMAFTEQGVAMLSGVLKSRTAIQVHIQIIRVFTRMKELLITHKDILLQLEKIERKLAGHDQDLLLVFQHLKELLHPPNPPRPRVGFRRKEEKD